MRKRLLTTVFATIAIVMFCSVGTVNAQKIFKVTSADQADVKVYVESNPEQCDLKVFTVTEMDQANKDGLWFETANAEEAAIKVFVTTDANAADMKISYVATADAAGWVTTNKRQYLKGKK